MAAIAAMIMVGTGVAWGSVRSFESGIFHFTAAMLGGSRDDGALDIMLVGMDSRTDAHGNPLSDDELAQLHAGGSHMWRSTKNFYNFCFAFLFSINLVSRRKFANPKIFFLSILLI